MAKNETYCLTPYGILLTELGDEKRTLKILNEMELACRRLDDGQPAILLKGTDSSFIHVKFKKNEKAK